MRGLDAMERRVLKGLRVDDPMLVNYPTREEIAAGCRLIVRGAIAFAEPHSKPTRLGLDILRWTRELEASHAP